MFSHELAKLTSDLSEPYSSPRGWQLRSGSNAMVGSRCLRTGRGIPRPGWKHTGDALPAQGKDSSTDVRCYPQITQRHPPSARWIHPRDWCYLGELFSSSSSQRGCWDERLRSLWVWFVPCHRLLSEVAPSPPRTHSERSCHFRACHSRVALPRNSGIRAGADHVHPQGLERDSQNKLWKDTCVRRSRESHSGEKG